MKPANILLTSARDLKLADLGLARTLDMKSAAGTRSDGTGAVGTFAYMAPEVLALPPMQTLSTSGDIWSVGMVALQLASMEATQKPIGQGDLATMQEHVEERLTSVAGSVNQSYIEAVRYMLTVAHDERATASELLCETAFYGAAAKLRDARPDLAELSSLEKDAEKLAAKKQAAAAAEALAAAEAEKARLRAGGCPAGAEHEWQWHTGTHGTGKACLKCLEVQDTASSKTVWSSSSDDERSRILAGGCPSGSLRQYGGLGSGPAELSPLEHAWTQGSDVALDGRKDSGRMCTRCGLTEDSSGKVILLPQLLGAFGPVKVNSRLAGR